MAFFAGNPFSTPVGQKIEQATSEQLATENWALNLEICDFINSSEESAKDAAKAIRKRLSHSPKNYKVVMYTLVVLETCVKNCGGKFHFLICSKDFVQDLVKLIGPKNDPPAAIQSKVLSLIQVWAETFRHQPELSGVCQVYADLRHKGVEFPPPEADATPILTPSPTVAPKDTINSASPRPAPIGGASPRHPTANTLATPQQPQAFGLTADVKSKLEKELGVVESNATVLAEMLNELTPGQEHSDDLTLLQELHATCQTMQKRVVDLVGRISDDLLTADLLRINDLLNNLFIRYDRYMAKSRAKGSPVRSPDEGGALGASHRPASTRTLPPGGAEEPASVQEASLIDLNDDPPPAAAVLPEAKGLTSQMAGLDLLGPNKAEEADFDSFAQSRTAPLEPSRRGGDGGDADTPLDPVLLDQVQSNFDSMERWISAQPYDSEISSDAFQKFLAERATAADNLPTIAAATGSNAAAAASPAAAAKMPDMQQ